MQTTRKRIAAIAGLVLLSLGAFGCSGARSEVSNAKPTEAPTTSLAAPNGPYAVGTIDLPMPNSIAYYPAQAETGTGQHAYVDATLLAGMGSAAAAFSTLTTTSRTAASPLVAERPRPVVILAPGFGSMIALSTSLAEHLASHGYVVVAVQTDLAAETAAMMPNEAQGRARTKQIIAALNFIETSAFERIVGPVDQSRIAIGGHSYAGSIAFNVSLHDARVSAVFDLDGLMFDEAATVPTKVPSLVITSVGSGAAGNSKLQAVATSGTNTVAVGLVDAQHFDLTDAAALAGLFKSAGVPMQLGTIGAVATSDTSIIVQRFLDSAFNDEPRLPTGVSLIEGLPSTTADAFTGSK